MQYRHWKCQEDANNILWVFFDREDMPVNTFNADVLNELSELLETVAHARYQAIVFASAKKKGFIAGADVEQFTHLETEEEAFQLIRQGQVVFSQLESLTIPTIALIQGFCLGGGLEFALACRYRIAEDARAVRIGLPEVMLGIHPGWGGCIRLPRLIGGFRALPLIVSGRTLEAKQAGKIGLVDAVVPQRQIQNAVMAFAKRLPSPYKPSFIHRLSNVGFLRSLYAMVVKRSLDKKIKKAFYPAPYAALKLWETNGISENAYIEEAKSLSHFIFNDTAKALTQLFFLQNKMKKTGQHKDFHPQYVHVVGAGTMGGDIASWCVLRGLTVTLQDQTPDHIAPAIKRAYTLFKKKRKQDFEVQALVDRLIPDPHGYGVKKADVVIEAIYENKDAKQTLYKIIEPQLKEGAILATNTSSIPLEDLAQCLRDPTRLVGLHFFNPVAKMQLVEVVKSEFTREAVFEKAMTFTQKIDRLPLPVKSHPGFLVNRCLMPYLMESVVLLEEGYSPEAIDQGALDYGMPMGPIELADKVGLDVCLSVANILTQYFGGEIPKLLKDKVEAGDLGQKSGKGFYAYKSGKIDKSSEEGIPEDLVNRMIDKIKGEVQLCLEEGVVESPDYAKAGMVFGTGYPPFKSL